MSEIIMDIDDAMRVQKLQAFWHRYGQWLAALVLAFLAALVASVLWQNHMDERYLAQTDLLTHILDEKAADGDLAQKLSDAGGKTDLPLNFIVKLYAAQKYEQAGNTPKAQEIYKTIREQKLASAVLQDLATIHFVRLGLLAGQEAGGLLPMLDEMIAAPQKPFYGSAMELRGLLLRAQGKGEEANKLFSTLAAADAVPATLRARARSLIVYEPANAQ